MTEASPIGGETNMLEQEIAQIEQDLASKRMVLEQQKQSGAIAEMPHEKETLREVVGERVGTSVPAPQPILGQQPVAGSQQPAPSVEPPVYLSPELKEKVQELVSIAFSQSPSDAIKRARATNNAALIDAFHDAIVDELYNYLVERGKLQKL